MKKRHGRSQSTNYKDHIYHYRRLLHLHFDLDLPLYPFCYEDMIRDADNAWFQSPGDPFLVLVALEKGETIYEIEGKDHIVSPGKVLFVPEFAPYIFRSYGYQHKYVLEIKGSHLSSILSSLQLNKTSVFDIDDFPAFIDELKAIGERVDTSKREEFFSIMGQCYEMITRLALQKLDRSPKSSILPRILDLLELDFETKLTIADLEKATGISKMTLTRMVKKHTGMTPMQYRISRKIERAIYFLQLPDMTIKEIAYRLGFCNQFYFSEQFRQFTGRAPSDYREYQKTLAKEH